MLFVIFIKNIIMRYFMFSFLMLWTTLFTKAQIISGPMLGNNTMREVTVWIQTEEPEEVYMEYWESGQEEKRQTPVYHTFPFHGNTAHLVATFLEPGTKYEYAIFVNGEQFETPYPTTFSTQPLWQYRTDPPAFKFAMGSCLYTNDPPYDRPGTPYGDTSEAIFGSILKTQADFMLWLGDNVYLRVPDFDSHSGVYHRYTDYKSRDSLQPLWASMHHYATWDDHDFGPNNSDRSYIYKDLTRQAFIDFWANPTYGDNNEGIYTEFIWSDCQFILLDDRYFRTPNDREEEGRTILGKKQLEWLKDRLVNTRAAFKFVAIGGQVLNPSAVYENYATYEEERNEIIDFIYEYDIENVIFLTGDRHKAELTKLAGEGEPVIYDVTASPLSAGTYSGSDREDNYLRVPGTLVTQRNFATVEVSGPFRERTLIIRMYDKFGKELWNHQIGPE